MIINKFGGASIKDSTSIKHVAKICISNIQTGVIVVSAMGKTTNLLEQLALKYFKKQNYSNELELFVRYHRIIIEELFSTNHKVYGLFNNLLGVFKNKLTTQPKTNYDYEYDQIVPYGELAASLIVSEYLILSGCQAKLIDARYEIKTNADYRNAKVDWTESYNRITKAFFDYDKKLYITQGFIGSTIKNESTTLGREGSDFSAAILGFILNASKVVVWKDVVGVLCADPDWIPNTDKIEQLSYYDAIELAFYGAKVIHPKTIKPLENKKIPLQVRSFIQIENQGTLIHSFENLTIPPVYIKKENQVLISIKPTDYSFIVEENLSHIFSILANNRIGVNLMQNSAVSFSIIVDSEMFRVEAAIAALKEFYTLHYKTL